MLTGNKAPSGVEAFSHVPSLQASTGRTRALHRSLNATEDVFLPSINYQIAPHDALVSEVGVTVTLVLQLGKQSHDSEVQ